VKEILLLLSLVSITSTIFSETLSSYRCFELEGAKIIAADGTFLGTLDDSYSEDSIFNDYSDYGAEYSSDSIWNEYNDWGNSYSLTSPFNEHAADPPILIKEGEIVGKLTVKSYEVDAVDPNTAGKDCGWDR